MVRRAKPERSLRNERVGEAYMIMLDVYEQCKDRGITGSQIYAEIDKAKPWRTGQEWLDEAWLIAQREFAKDYGLPPRASTNL